MIDNQWAISTGATLREKWVIIIVCSTMTVHHIPVLERKYKPDVRDL